MDRAVNKAQELSDRDLALQLQQGQRLALNDLMFRYKEKLYRFAWRNVRNEDVAQDVVQEAFVKAYFNIGKYDPHYAFSTWIYQITLNLCRDHHRRNFFRKYDTSLNLAEGSEHLQLAGDAPDSTNALSSKQELANAHKAIQALPKKLGEALILYVFEEKSQQECADILGVSAKTIETRIYRARRLLAEAMNRNNFAS